MPNSITVESKNKKILRIKPSSFILVFITLLLISAVLQGCESADKKTDANDILQAKVDGAVSCTINGLTRADSVLYMHGGGSEFKPTIVNRDNPKSVPG